MSSVQAVLWDMDGVLLDSEKLCQQAFVDVVGREGLVDNPAQKYLETVGLNHKSTVDWYMPLVKQRDRAEYFYQAVRDRYTQIIEQELELKSGVLESLNAVQALGLPQMVVTSSSSAIANEKLNRMNIRDYFVDVIGGDQVEQGKPNPEPYLKACDSLSLAPENALVVEDSPNGVAAGVAAGAMVVHVPDLLVTDPAWVNEIYDALESLLEFPDWLLMQQGRDWV